MRHTAMNPTVTGAVRAKLRIRCQVVGFGRACGVSARGSEGRAGIGIV